jgi:hypothetical protein
MQNLLGYNMLEVDIDGISSSFSVFGPKFSVFVIALEALRVITGVKERWISYGFPPAEKKKLCFSTEFHSGWKMASN